MKRAIEVLLFLGCVGLVCFGYRVFGAERQTFFSITHRDCLVRTVSGTSGGTGIVVDGSGVIATVKHVLEAGKPVSVRFDDGRRFDAKVIGVSGHADLALLKIEAPKPLLYCDVAADLPAAGAKVVSEGYPSGQYSSQEGTVLGIQMMSDAPNGKKSEIVVTSHRVQSGNSGGPLYDTSGDIVGLAWAVPKGEENVQSLFVSGRELRVLMRQFNIGPGAAAGPIGFGGGIGIGKHKPRLWIIVAKGCSECQLFERDYGAHGTPADRSLRHWLDRHYAPLIVPWEEAAQIRAGYGVTGAPAFVVEGHPPPLYRYSNGADLMARLTGQQQPIQQPPPGSMPPQQLPPEDPESALAPSWHFGKTPDPEKAVTVAILVKHTKKFDVWGGGASALEKLVEGPVRRKMQEEFAKDHFSVDIEMIFERVEPVRYGRVTDLVGDPGSDNEPVVVAVLVKKQWIPLLGGVVGRVETAIKANVDHKLKMAHVHGILEHEQQTDYDNILEAIRFRDAERGGFPILLGWLLGGLLGTGPGSRSLRAWLEHRALSQGMKA